ncbi:MAG TPA: DNA polymerase Y family protein [Terriglobales bacterium]|nr:DNA polymerase Y family protein [Terriglobales bacterium]
MLFACIFVPDFPVEALLRTTPELRKTPVAVLDGTPPMLTVIAANVKGREAGITIGMTKLQAEACPTAHLRRRSLTQEIAARDALLDCAHAFSPRVEDTNQQIATADGKTSPSDTVILDVSGLERLFGPPAKLARTIVGRVSNMGLTANIAVASNPDAAMHAARGFSGVTVIAPGTEAERLGTLPIHLLQPSEEMLETLEHWGIRDFRGLAALPTIALSQRLGQEGLRLQKLAQGRAERTLVPVEPVTKFEEAIELEDAVELLEPLAFILNRLLEQMCARLKARSLAASELRLALELTGYEDQSAEEQEASKSVHQRTFQFPVPMQDSRTFLKLLQLDLSAHPPQGPVKKIFLAAQAAPPRFAQAGLFLPRGPAPERLELILARIRGIVGDDRVGSPELLDTHAPSAFRMHPFRPNVDSTKHDRQSQTHKTALRIFRPPLQAKVQIKQGVPTRIFLRGQAHQVTAAAGPWRNNGGWWTEQAWTRDEWDLELRTEESSPWLVRMYRDLSSSKWYVESTFD